MAASPNGSEEGSQEEEVVARLLCCVGQRHGAVDDLVEVRL